MSSSIFKKFRLENMLISFVSLSFLLILSAYSYAQNTHIQGVWENSYGSIMKIETLGNQLKGCYSSQTTSPGSFYLDGFTKTSLNPKYHSTTLAIAISWRAYNKIQTDSSLHWTSSMSGMYSVDESSGATVEKIELINAINAPGPTAGANTEAGLYPGTLVFSRYSNQNWKCPDENEKINHLEKVKIGLNGVWQDGNSSLTLIKDKEKNGLITGIYADSKFKFPLVGYFDYAPEQKPRVPTGAVSISFVVSNLSLNGVDHKHQLAFSGNLMGEKLELFTFKTFDLVGYTSSKLIGKRTFIKNTHKVKK